MSSILLVFVVGYLLIMFEHTLRIDKAAIALLTGSVCWILYAKSGISAHALETQVGRNVGEIAEVVLFLIGAMTIVEMIDAHGGFSVLTDKIKISTQRELLVVVGFGTFCLSAILDNLTTTIVVVSMLRKIVADREKRLVYVGLTVVAANAGGVFSPIGNITSTMLWVGGQISTSAMILYLVLPSLVAVAVPMYWYWRTMDGPLAAEGGGFSVAEQHYNTTSNEQLLVFVLGIGGLIFAPILKVLTHLPPFMGMLFSLGVMWTCTELMHRTKATDERERLGVKSALKHIDTISILFFIGILFAVAALAEAGHLTAVAESLKKYLGYVYPISIVVGFVSSVVDNVPLVAAVMKMYPIAAAGSSSYWDVALRQDGAFWLFLAYSTGVGGSLLILGSAPGIAVMGLEQISFTWYLKNITVPALLGYLAGACVCMVLFLF